MCFNIVLISQILTFKKYPPKEAEIKCPYMFTDGKRIYIMLQKDASKGNRDNAEKVKFSVSRVPLIMTDHKNTYNLLR
jgi:hypothetical protein